jgi:hypothetical protein
MLILLVFVFFCLAMLGMAIGVMVRRRPLEGACGRSCDCRSLE